MSDDECPICYKKYGEQEEGYFLCRDGKENSYYADACKHYICVECCHKLIGQETVLCPICREDWTQWIHSRYPLEDSDEEESEEDDHSSDSDYEYDSEENSE
jgi:hypothetical protein|nr:MAG: hypothetical protein [Lake Baikal virophage 12]